MSQSLAALEIPRCGCRVFWIEVKVRDGEGELLDTYHILSPPCVHVLACYHDLSVAEWACRLLASSPQTYAEPPLPRPALALTREARIVLMEGRRERCQALRHPGDVLALSHLGVLVLEDGSERLVVQTSALGGPTE